MEKNSMYFQVFLLATAQALFQVVSIIVMTVGGLASRQITTVPELVTLPIATMFLGTAILTFPASMWMNKIGRRSGFILGTLAGAAGGIIGVLGILYSSLLLYSLGTFLVGTFQAFAQFYRFAASEVATPSFRPKAISLAMAGGIVAAFAGPYLGRLGGPLLRPEYIGSFVIITLISIVSAILLMGLRVPVHTDRQIQSSKGRPLYQIILQPSYMVALFGAATGYGIMVLAMTATPLAMVGEHGLEAVAVVIQLHVLGMFVPSFFTGSLITRFGILRIMFVGVLLSVGYVLVCTTGTSFIAFAVALTLIGVGWNFLFIGGTALLIKTYTAEEKGKAQATNDMSIFVVNLVCSFSAAGLLHVLGWEWMNIALLPWLCIAGLSIIWLAYKKGAMSESFNHI